MVCCLGPRQHREVRTVAPAAPERRASSRIPLFDNVKFVLICSVVVGHLLKVCNLHRRRYARATFVFIYAFHMPLFLFVSGLFVNRSHLTWEATRKHALRYAAYGFLAKLLRAVVPWLLGEPFEFTPFEEQGLPWFMFALAVYYLLAWFLRSYSYLKVGCVALLLSLAVGYTDLVGDVLCLSRIIVFFPFFWLGHALRTRDVAAAVDDARVRRFFLGTLAIFALLCLTKTKAIYPYHKLFIGRHSYADVSLPGWGWVHRAVAYLVSLTVGAGVLASVPRSTMPHMTLWGQRTLQVYLLHFEVIDALEHLRAIRHLYRWGSWGWLTLIPLGIAIACILSIPSWETIKSAWQQRAQ